MGAVGGDHASEAHVDAVAAEESEAGVQPVDLEVSFHCRAADATRCAECAVEAQGGVGNAFADGLGDRGEVLVVGRDEGRNCFGREAFGEVESAGGGEVHDGSESIMRARNRAHDR